MAEISSISKSTYPYRGTLSRLDMNGDGVLSREEIAADDRPGILSELSQDDTEVATKFRGGLMAKLMEMRDNGSAGAGGVPESLLRAMGLSSEVDEASSSEADAHGDVYASTYGQYDFEEQFSSSLN